MKFKIDQIVKAKKQIIEEACGDYPGLILCEKGQELKIKSCPDNDIKGCYYCCDIKGDYGDFSMYESELEFNE